MGYRGKIEQQNRARDLRAQGWTLTEICEEVGCSKASASTWCRDVEIHEEALAARQEERAAAGRRRAQVRGPNALQRRKLAEIAEMRGMASRSIGQMTQRDLLIAGAALYAGEGSKRDGALSLANSDPRMIALFLEWLRALVDVDEARLRVRLYLHQGLDLDAAVQFWSSLTRIPVSQFRKPYRAVPDPSIRLSKHPMGCATVAYSCSRSHRLIMGLVEALLFSIDPGGGPPPPSDGEIIPG
jgi:hypothetical protein